MTDLVKYEAARRALAEASTVDEVKTVRDKSLAMQLYAKQAKNTDMEEQCVRIRLHAEKRLGEMMEEQKATVGLAKAEKKTGALSGFQKPQQGPPTLEASGIDKNLAKRARKARTMTDEAIDQAAVAEIHRDRRASREREAASMVLDGGATMNQAAAATGVGSSTVMRRSVAYEQGYRAGLSERSASHDLERAKAQSAKEALLQQGLKNSRAQIAALTKEIARLEKLCTLSPEHSKRLQAMLRRFRAKDQRTLKAQLLANNERIEKELGLGRRRTGYIPAELREVIVQCLHPDGNPSADVKAKAFMGWKEREDILCSSRKAPDLKIVR